MPDAVLRSTLSRAVDILRASTELTVDEIIGLGVPPADRTVEVAFSLGVLEGAATALRVTRRELLEEFDLLTAPRRAV
jgi:hypothetical protein